MLLDSFTALLRYRIVKSLAATFVYAVNSCYATFLTIIVTAGYFFDVEQKAWQLCLSFILLFVYKVIKLFWRVEQSCSSKYAHGFNRCLLSWVCKNSLNLGLFKQFLQEQHLTNFPNGMSTLYLQLSVWPHQYQFPTQWDFQVIYYPFSNTHYSRLWSSCLCSSVCEVACSKDTSIIW